MPKKHFNKIFAALALIALFAIIAGMIAPIFMQY